MNTIHIRVAARKDLPALDSIEKTCFPADRRSNSRALRHSLKSPAQRVLTAVSERHPVGAMVLYLYPRSIRIYSLAVLPEFRGGGTGRKMVQQAVALARRTGRTAVTLEAAQSNRTLTRWYESFGFQTKKILQDYYSPRRHAVRMRLDLKTALKGGSSRGRS